MVKCAVKNCKNYEGNKYCTEKPKYFTFPKDKNICELWIKLSGNNNYNIDTARICSDHFVEEDYRLQDILLNVEISKRRLKKGAIPSRNLPVSEDHSAKGERMYKTKRKQIVHEAISEYEENQGNLAEIVAATVSCDLGINETNNVATQTIGNLDSILKKENERLKRLLWKEGKEKFIFQKQLVEEREKSKDIKNLFTKAQINKLRNPHKKIRWHSDDIKNAISLHSAGAKCYRLLRARGHPLPSVSTLKKWAAKQHIPIEHIYVNVRKVIGNRATRAKI